MLGLTDLCCFGLFEIRSANVALELKIDLLYCFYFGLDESGRFLAFSCSASERRLPLGIGFELPGLWGILLELKAGVLLFLIGPCVLVNVLPLMCIIESMFPSALIGPPILNPWILSVVELLGFLKPIGFLPEILMFWFDI